MTNTSKTTAVLYSLQTGCIAARGADAKRLHKTAGEGFALATVPVNLRERVMIPALGPHCGARPLGPAPWGPGGP